jgi:hypothetical protein
MNQKPKPTPQTELDRRYSESGDAEPAAGLDRMILARADQALGNARRARRRPMLAGLATASVALVALAVVLQQTPSAPEPAGTFDRSDAGIVVQESASTDLEPPVADAAHETVGEARREPEAPAARSRGTGLEVQLPDSKPAAPAAEAGVEPKIDSFAPSLQSITVTGSRIASDEHAVDHQPGSSHERLFEQLRALIADGNPDQARQLLQEALATEGRIVLPEDLRKALGTSNEPD